MDQCRQIKNYKSRIFPRTRNKSKSIYRPATHEAKPKWQVTTVTLKDDGTTGRRDGRRVNNNC